jgi:hypothetical protein
VVVTPSASVLHSCHNQRTALLIDAFYESCWQTPLLLLVVVVVGPLLLVVDDLTHDKDLKFYRLPC